MLKKYEFEYEELDAKEALCEEDLALLNAAFKAVETAFAPYSKFKVGAAARLSNGQIIAGSNQESASYPVGICAERTLLNSIITYLQLLGDFLCLEPITQITQSVIVQQKQSTRQWVVSMHT